MSGNTRQRRIERRRRARGLLDVLRDTLGILGGMVFADRTFMPRVAERGK